MEEKQFCYICGNEIPKGERVNLVTENGVMVICADCDRMMENNKDIMGEKE